MKRVLWGLGGRKGVFEGGRGVGVEWCVCASKWFGGVMGFWGKN